MQPFTPSPVNVWNVHNEHGERIGSSLTRVAAFRLVDSRPGSHAALALLFRPVADRKVTR